MFRISLTTLFTLLFAAELLFAGKYNDTLSIGDPAPEWTGLPGVDGKMHGLADLKDKKVVVLFFTCNSCPAAIDYEDRIIQFTKKYVTSSVAVVGINVNTIEEDRLPKMKERARLRQFNFPYLFDETQKVGRSYGARYTPEFFVLNKDRKVTYMGAMDDKDLAEKVTQRYLESAVESALQDREPTVSETLGRGCMIRYEKKRMR
jgi:peroxiredoxin